ncbi:MAG: chromate efflux transporter [Paracoccaceae bacterium]|nr:chromate efflux transporter [Paracoccaceae bacterium]
MASLDDPTGAAASGPLALADLARVFGRIGVLSFGGPAAQIALMHRELVEDRPWLTEEQYLRALSFCMLLPGPEAMQLATYAGWRLRGVAGGLIAGGLFVLPGAIVIAALASVYAVFGAVPLVEAAFVGIKAAVVAIVLQALWRLSGKALRRPANWAVAALAFVAIFAFGLPFPAIIAGAALWGAVSAGARVPAGTGDAPRPGPGHVATVLTWLALWLLPLLALHLFAPAFLAEVGLFFSQLAVVTFGGAYAVLAYMTQEIVADLGWITTEEMLVSLGLAETTPGPLILVTEFVAFLAGFKEGGFPLAFAAAATALWVTFIPCFLWIFAAAPWIEWITARPRLQSALAAITAAVVGVILNLSLWFALHVVFDDLVALEIGPVSVLWPVWPSLDPAAAALAVLAGAALFLGRFGLVPLIGCAALAGLALGAVG